MPAAQDGTRAASAPVAFLLELRHPEMAPSPTVEWAKASGVVRVARGRIVAVRKHAKLLERPAELVCRMLAAIPQLGAAMGWQDSHLHVFEHGSDRYGFPHPDLDILDDREVTLGALLVHPGDLLGYEYDFGDSWQHAIVLSP